MNEGSFAMSMQEQIKYALEKNATETVKQNLYKIGYKFDEAPFEVNDVIIKEAELKGFTYEQIVEKDSYIEGACTLLSVLFLK